MYFDGLAIRAKLSDLWQVDTEADILQKTELLSILYQKWVRVDGVSVIESWADEMQDLQSEAEQFGKLFVQGVNAIG